MFPRVALISALLASTLTAQSQRPHVVLVTIDTLRADHLPMWGAEDVRTPRLQRCAEESVIFEQAVTAVPLTLPAHASLLTGTIRMKGEKLLESQR